MSYFPLTEEQQGLKELAANLAERELAPRAAETDSKRQFPRASLEGLKSAGLWGLRVDKDMGGLGADLLSDSSGSHTSPIASISMSAWPF